MVSGRRSPIGEAAQVLVWATQRFNLVRYNEPHASHRRREPVPPDSLLRGGEIVPLHIANGKMIRSAIADMRIVCDAYLNGMTIPSR
jgi:hypothetical protein